MTKKKRNHPDLDEVLARPWCYYCERDFDDLKILINHQKAKHFKCERCGRRLNTAGGLSVHMSQVHKENLTAVDNALPNRAGLDIEIFGMEGIPEDIVQQHTQRVLASYHQTQAERQAASGNGPGASGASGPKKPKIESVSELKKRLAEHKAAKLAAEQGDGSQSGGGTPQPTPQAQASPSNGYGGSPAYAQYQQPYNAPATNGGYNQPPSYSPAPPAPGFPQQHGYGQTQSSQSSYGQPPTPHSYQSQPYAQPPQPSFQHQGQASYPPQPAFSPPPYQTQSAHPGPPYQQNGSNPYAAHSSGPRPYNAGSPAPPFPQHTSPPPNSASFPKPIATGSVSLPTAPGLPQRPAFGAPPVNAFQFQQMHQGQLPVPQNHSVQPQYHPQSTPPSAPQPQANGPIPVSMTQNPNLASIDDLISSASKQADANAAAAQSLPTPPPAKAETPTAATTPAPTKEEVADEKAGKKEKEKAKATRLVYSDNETSPEEKMAMLPRYAFNHENRSVVV